MVLNPTSGRGRGAAFSKELAGYRILETRGPGHATELAQLAVEEGHEVIAAAGGDGTLSEVMRGILGSSASLAVLPVGTGNDFARHLGIGTDIPAALSLLKHGEPQTIDVGMLNGTPFLNVVSCGFDAVVGERINRGYGWAKGTLAYILAVFQSLATYQAAPLVVTVDGTRHEFKAMLCAVANASSYGGGMRIAPEASLSDGLLDVVILGEISKLEFLRQFPKVFKGSHITHPAVTVLRGREVAIHSERELPILNDGDLQGTTPAELAVRPQSLKFLLP